MRYRGEEDTPVIGMGGSVELDRLDEIKRLTLIGLFSDDDLMDTLVLKGGNALDIVHHIAPRASIDIDLSKKTTLT